MIDNYAIFQTKEDPLIFKIFNHNLNYVNKLHKSIYFKWFVKEIMNLI